MIYGILAVMGLIPGLSTLFGLAPLFGHDVWLHGLTALLAAYFGFGPRRDPVARERVLDAEPRRQLEDRQGRDRVA